MNGYRYDQEFAFLPVWPGEMRLAGELVRWTRWRLCGIAWETSTSDVLLGGIILANICSIFAVYMFQRLTFSLTRSKSFTSLSTLLYVFNPVPAISSSPCTEPLFALLTFTGYYLISTSSPNNIASTSSTARRKFVSFNLRRVWVWIREGAGVACLALAAGTRSLGILAVVVAGWPVLERLWYLQLRSFKRTLLVTIKAGLKALVIVAPFILFQYYGYLSFCTTGGSVDGERPWCKRRLPLIYSFVQEHYWNVGFLRYWTIPQIPNFFLPAPVLLISLYGIYVFYRPILSWFLPLPPKNISRRERPAIEREADLHLWKNPRLRPYFVIHLITTLTLILSAHVQIALRGSITNPVIWWILAGTIVEQDRADERGTSGRRLSKWGRRWIHWCMIWGAISLVLWGGFYPPA